MGNQGYSNDGARVAAEILWSGELGNVTEVHAWTTRPVWPQGMQTIPAETKIPDTLDWDLWLGVAQNRPFTAGEQKEGTGVTASGPASFGRTGFYLPFNWRGHYDFGCGPLGDMACHLLGAVNMGLLLGAPKSVEVIQQEGGSKFAFPKRSVTVFEFPARKNMAPLKLYWYDASTGPGYKPEGWTEEMPLIGGEDAFGWNPPPPPRPANAPPPRQMPRGFANREGVVYIGDKGMMTTDTYANRVRLLPEAKHKEFKLPNQMLTRSPGHYRDWIRACKGGDAACSNFAVAGPFTEWITMGVIALHFEGKLEWDATKMEFTNNKAANEYVKPTFRKGWKFAG
jgi:hypothetical protein